jgi:hypothetical protein
VGSEAAPGTAEQHATLEDLVLGVRVTGLTSSGAVEVIATQWHGTDVATIVFRASDGRPDQQVVLRSQESRLRIVPAEQAARFDGDPAAFKQASADEHAECGRGLLLVEALCEEWGWYLPEDVNAGKWVWGAVALHVPGSALGGTAEHACLLVSASCGSS